MSLVSEALRKARQEAAEKGAKQRGVIFRTTVVLGSEGARPWLGWIVAGVVAASGLAGAGVAWFVFAGRGRTPAPVAPAARPAVTAPSALTNLAVSGPTAPPLALAAAEPAPSAAPGGGVELTAIPVAGRHQRPEAAAPDARPPTPSMQTTALAVAPPGPRTEPGAELAPRPANATASRERSFVLDADLGKVKLHLDYIVYRSKNPFAGINGQQVTIGSLIEGFTVEEIDTEAVRLRDGKGIVVLRVH
ncbi:MAG: hypothetical protein LAO05_15715 [Acidobacteriia bacterium]|nr:hypothetical protein [Terriglobia bacterium]